jgi:hypothetical protein
MPPCLVILTPPTHHPIPQHRKREGRQGRQEREQERWRGERGLQRERGEIAREGKKVRERAREKEKRGRFCPDFGLNCELERQPEAIDHSQPVTETINTTISRPPFSEPYPCSYDSTIFISQLAILSN